jgi:hypothetical protein
MAHVNLGAGIYSTLAIGIGVPGYTPGAIYTQATLEDFFETQVQPSDAGTVSPNTKFILVDNIREFPALGIQPNIVNVPVFGSATSRQVQGQADAPSFELQINYDGVQWDSASFPGKMVGDGDVHLFRVTLQNEKPAGYASVPGALGIGSQKNSSYYFFGKLEAISVQPNLNDANLGTLTVSVQSDMYGAFTLASA